MLSIMEKITISERVAREYPAQDKADFLGLGVYYGQGLGLAIYPKTYETIKNVSNFDSPERRGADLKLVVSIAKATAYIENAIKIYPLSFSKKDVENEVARLKNLKAQGLIEKTRNNGEIFEAWAIAELSGQGNSRMNASKYECGDCRLEGLEIQIKYNKGGFYIKE